MNLVTSVLRYHRAIALKQVFISAVEKQSLGEGTVMRNKAQRMLGGCGRLRLYQAAGTWRWSPVKQSRGKLRAAIALSSSPLQQISVLVHFRIPEAFWEDTDAQARGSEEQQRPALVTLSNRMTLVILKGYSGTRTLLQGRFSAIAF